MRCSTLPLITLLCCLLLTLSSSASANRNCQDIAPIGADGRELNCAQHAAWGKCNERYMRGLCLSSCNRCTNNCEDIAPMSAAGQPEHTCKQFAQWGMCDTNTHLWMRPGLCMQSCKRCGTNNIQSQPPSTPPILNNQDSNSWQRRIILLSAPQQVGVSQQTLSVALSYHAVIADNVVVEILPQGNYQTLDRAVQPLGQSIVAVGVGTDAQITINVQIKRQLNVGSTYLIRAFIYGQSSVAQDIPLSRASAHAYAQSAFTVVYDQVENDYQSPIAAPPPAILVPPTQLPVYQTIPTYPSNPFYGTNPLYPATPATTLPQYTYIDPTTGQLITLPVTGTTDQTSTNDALQQLLQGAQQTQLTQQQLQQLQLQQQQQNAALNLRPQPTVSMIRSEAEPKDSHIVTLIAVALVGIVFQ